MSIVDNVNGLPNQHCQQASSAIIQIIYDNQQLKAFCLRELLLPLTGNNFLFQGG